MEYQKILKKIDKNKKIFDKKIGELETFEKDFKTNLNKFPYVACLVSTETNINCMKDLTEYYISFGVQKNKFGFFVQRNGEYQIITEYSLIDFANEKGFILTLETIKKFLRKLNRNIENLEKYNRPFEELLKLNLENEEK